MNREYIVVRYLDDGYNYEIYRVDENGKTYTVYGYLCEDCNKIIVVNLQ